MFGALQLGLGLTHRQGGGVFVPGRDLYQPGDVGFWYDPSDLTTQFTDVNGTTPVVADGDSVGLVLDKWQWGGKTLEQVLAAQPELVTNGTFDSDTAWTKGTGWTIGSGVATRDATATGSNLSVGSFVEVGKLYRIQWTQSGTGYIAVYLGTAAGPLVSNSNTPGTYTRLAVATQTGGILFRGSTAIESIDNVSVKIIPGNHLFQSVTNSKPKYKTSTGLHWWLFDGSDDGWYSGASFAWGSDKAASAVGLYRATTATQIFVEFSSASPTNVGAWGVYSDNATAKEGVAFARGDAAAVAGQGATLDAATPDTASILANQDISGDLSRIWRAGVAATDGTADKGAGNYGTYQLFVGRRNNSSFPLNGRITDLFGRNRLWTDAERSRIDQHITRRAGI